MKKFSFFIIMIVFIFGLFIQPIDATTVHFKDVNQQNSHYEGIYYLVNEGIINGYSDNTYKPDKTITRSQTAALFTRTLKLPKEKFIKVYKDIDKKHEYADEIISAWRAGIFGRTNNYFNDGPLNREQMATVLVRAFDLEDNGKTVDANLANISPSHKANVNILFQHGITNQKNNYRPYESVTRGQFATFLYRVMTNTDINEGMDDEDKEVRVVHNEKELASALSSNSSNKIVEIGNNIELTDTITVNNEGVKIKGYSKGKNHKITGASKKTLFEIKASNVHFDGVHVLQNNGIAFHVLSTEGFKYTGGFIFSANDSYSGSGIIVEDKFTMGVDETATISNNTIIVPDIGVSFAGGILRLDDNLIEDTSTALKFTSIEVPRSMEGNIFFNNYEDIQTDYVPAFDKFLPLNHFDYNTPKINRR